MTSHLPNDFVLGVSNAAYQIEGGWDADGKGESVWDRYAHTPGKIDDGDTGDVASDHYQRWAEDLDLVRDAGLGPYRFSAAWTRVMPEGRGAVNLAGLDFYDRIVDGCLERGVEPWLCFHHWDIPQVLEDRGGWTSPDVVGWFSDYAEIMVARFADRVQRWIPLNEPKPDRRVPSGSDRGARDVARGAGKIINVASLMSAVARPGTGAYTASKGGIAALTRAMCVEWAPHGVQANALSPGRFATDLNAALVADEAFDRWIKGRTPAGRWGRVEELVGAAVFLASPASSFVNGQVLYVDGGVLAGL